MARAARTTRSAGSEQTRQLLVSTATRLFAEHGLDGVSLAEINRAAGQRNATALHYHFGGKEGLVQAIFHKHTERVSRLRETMLEQLPETADIANLVPVLIVPLAQQVLDEDGGIHYLLFLAQLMNNPGLPRGEMDRHSSQVLAEQLRRFQTALEHVPEEIRALRVNFTVLMTFNSLASYAAEVQRNGFDAARHQLVMEQLVAAAIAVLDFEEAFVSE
ncbi:MAG: TetR family transcriptional regulator [Gammaproteobacteria bacterium]|nr:TetR family transcriptional regulator [Gammaproteobacteria bacterium]